jgi:YggT family protein
VTVFLSTFVQLLLYAITALVFARVILSWVDPRGSNQVSAFIIGMTEPMLAPIRRVLPRTGMIDFSPTILLIVLFMLMRFV